MNRWRDWWRQSEMECTAAEHLLAAGDHAWCCFTCQQAVEKGLKAILESRSLPYEGHSLNRLLDAVMADSPRDVREACMRLNRHYIPTRYPDAVAEGAPGDQYSEGDARSAVTDARLVLEYLRALVRPTAP